MASEIAVAPTGRGIGATGDRSEGERLSLSEDICACIVVALVFALCAFAFQAWLDNKTIATTNGLWKSRIVAEWKVDPGWDRVDFSDFLYFPIQGLFCRFLDVLGFYPGQAWRQVALLNPIFGAIGAGAAYLFVRRWCHSRLLAVLATLFYCGCGFYMLLSLINENDMPNSVFVLMTTLLACALFPRISTMRIAIVAVVFSIAWLWEWRVLFPSFFPLLLATLVSPGRWLQRLLRPLVFLASMAILPAAITLAYALRPDHAGAKTPAAFFTNLFWTGKGVGTGWAGWSSAKIVFYWNGLFESVLGGRNLAVGPSLWDRQITREAVAATAVLMVLGLFGSVHAWRHRREPGVVVATVVLAGTFAAGSVFNLYSQPQDPQMVINIMVWTLPAAALVLGRILPAIPARAASLPWSRRAVALILAATPISYNAAALAQYRGGDSRAVATIDRLSARFDPKTTVYLYHGFDGVVLWHSLLQGGATDRTDELPSAPMAQHDFKAISVTTIPILQPRLSARDAADVWRGQIERVIDKGYHVVAASSMLTPDPGWRASFSTFAKPEVADAFRDVFNKTFAVHEVYSDPEAGPYFRVERRQK